MFSNTRIPYGTWGSSYFPAWQTSALAEVNIGQFGGEAMNRILGLRKVPKEQLDYLVIDAPPGTGDEPMAVAELAQPRAAAILVTTPQALAVADVRRSVTFCREMSLPVVGIIENMSGLVCPACGERIDLFKTGGGKKAAEEFDVPFLGSIPLDPVVVNSGEEGIPLVGSDSSAAKNFVKIVASVEEKVKERR